MLINEPKLKGELEDSLTAFKNDLSQLKTGKAKPSVVESVKVEAYGTVSPLNSIAQVIVEDAMNMKVVVWDKGVLADVDKALREASIGGSVAIDKDVIRIKFSPMTEEDRVETVKELKGKTEDYRVRVRLIRQKYMKDLEGLEGVSEDEQERDQNSIQKMIDQTIESIEKLANDKEQEILSV